jgi:Protein of unknown function (DUF4239)
MYALSISLVVFVLMFAGALAGVPVRPLLLEKHVHPDSREVVKMVTGLVGHAGCTGAGAVDLVREKFVRSETGQVRQMTATIILLDDLLGQYGPEATPVRALLRQSVQPLANRIWHEGASSIAKPVVFQSTAQLSAFENQLAGLSPNDDAQRSLQSRAIQAFTEGAQIRLQLFAQTGNSIPTPFLIILIFWLSAIFASFTLFSQTNLIVMASLFVCALSFAGAIFLVLELDNPFTGLMGISSATLRNALLPLSPA